MAGTKVQAQFLKNLGKRAKEAAEKTILKKTEEKAVEKSGEVMDSIFKKTERKKKKSKRTRDRESNDSDNDITTKDTDNEITDGEFAKEDMTIWTKYDFVSGDEIVFYDDLNGEENGEFPSRWDLLGGSADNATINGENVIRLGHNSKITPLIKNSKYLPEIFTIEFDVFFQPKRHDIQYYHMSFWNNSKGYGFSKDLKSKYESIKVEIDGAKFTSWINGGVRNYEFYDKSLKVGTDTSVWRHIALSFNRRSLKLYIDEIRILNIPNLDLNPELFVLGVMSYYKSPSAIKNIKIAKGGKKLYERIVHEGKFITRGILFDVNSANIKQESGGVLMEIANLMQRHDDLRFNIVGHTDSDGSETYNLELSALRAAAVKKALIKLGIDKNRLSTEGKGESVPILDNTTPEGKANNRRVEFVKL